MYASVGVDTLDLIYKGISCNSFENISIIFFWLILKGPQFDETPMDVIANIDAIVENKMDIDEKPMNRKRI